MDNLYTKTVMLAIFAVIITCCTEATAQPQYYDNDGNYGFPQNSQQYNYDPYQPPQQYQQPAQQQYQQPVQQQQYQQPSYPQDNESNYQLPGAYNPSRAQQPTQMPQEQYREKYYEYQQPQESYPSYYY